MARRCSCIHKAAMADALAAYQRGFAGRNVQICYAMKANSTLAILRLFASLGCGFDIVSGGELQRVIAAGGDTRKVIFSGVGKTRAEMRQALEADIGCFNVESEAELDVLNAVAQEAGLRAPVSIRVNPDVDAKTHPTSPRASRTTSSVSPTSMPSPSTGAQQACPACESWGSTAASARKSRRSSLSRLRGPHPGPGGGHRSHRHPHPPHRLRRRAWHRLPRRHATDADTLWARLFERIDARGFGQRRFMIEPGRSLVGNAGLCLTEVLYLKPGSRKLLHLWMPP